MPDSWGTITAKMAIFEIRTEPGQVTVELSPPIRLGGALLFLLGLAIFGVEVYVTFPYRARVVGTIPGVGLDGGEGFGWPVWIAAILGCILISAIFFAAQWRRLWMRREQIRFTSDAIVSSREFLVGRPRTDRYEMNSIQFPYFEPHKGIAFRYKGRTARIGVGMAHFEMMGAISAVIREFPETASLWARCTDEPQAPSPLPSIIAK